MISWDVWDSLRAYVVLLSCLFWGFRIIINNHHQGLSSGLVGRYEILLRRGLAHLINPMVMRLCDVLM